nr:hypothetical protein [Tanacetum cinerariifolium]
MSSASSAVTYTSVYTDSESGRVFWEPTRSYQRKPHDPDFVPEPIYPEYVPLEDKYILLAEEQPLPPFDSPIAESPEYVAESDPKKIKRITPSDIQYFAANKIWRCYRLASRAKFYRETGQKSLSGL